MFKRYLISGFALSVSIVAASFAIVASASADDQRPPRHEPPPEAFAACDGLSSGDACSVTFGEHEMKGTCREAND